MVNVFGSDRAFGEALAPKVDQCLRSLDASLFHTISRLRGNAGQVHALDRDFAIDGLVTTKAGVMFTFQEKIRRHSYLQYQDFTLEFHSNRDKKTEGEFFHLAADFYFHAYANKEDSGIVELRVLNVQKLKMFVHNHKDKLPLKENNVHSRANFFCIPFKDLRAAGIVFLEYILDPRKTTTIQSGARTPGSHEWQRD